MLIIFGVFANKYDGGDEDTKQDNVEQCGEQCQEHESTSPLVIVVCDRISVVIVPSIVFYTGL